MTPGQGKIKEELREGNERRRKVTNFSTVTGKGQ
jgi:hypothetical protein